MSDLTPFAIVAVALLAGPAVWLIDALVLGTRPAPGHALRAVALDLRAPLRHPANYDNVLFHGAPALLLLAATVALSVVPWAPGFRGLDFQAGALLFAGALAYVTPAIFMAGWGAGRPLAVVGAFRWIAVMLAYAMPVAMVITAAAAPAGSLRPVDIVEVQHAVPMALVQPLALALWLPAVAAVCFLPPFDLPQAGSELGGGVFSEYRGLDRLLITLAQRVLVVACAGMTAVLFLAGWNGPLLPPALWMALKTSAVVWLMLWSGRRVPRLTVDRALTLAWKVAIPLAILAIVISGGLTLAFYR